MNMSDETAATTSTDAGTGTTSEGSSSSTSTETAATGTDTSTQGTTSQEDSFNVAVDMDSIPPAQRPFVEKYVKQFEKQFKGEYTRKTQEVAAKVRAAELEATRFKEQNTMTASEIKAVLADPAKYEAYRKLYGFDAQTAQAPAETPKFNSVDELIQWNQQQMQLAQQTAEQRAQQAAAQTIQQHQVLSRWESAVDKQRSADPKFIKYESLVVKMAQDPKYLSLYHSGKSEAEVLSTVYGDLKGLLREEQEAVKQETLASLQRKKEATTVTPRKTVATNSSGGKASDAEVLARIEARLAGH